VNGKLQALQALNAAGAPITVESQTAVNAPDQVALHSYRQSFATKWVTVHDTAVEGNAPFNANVAAKTAHATPFKRPENGVFRPGTHFGEFYFTETGDTNATSVENDTAGGWGSLFKLTQSGPSALTGRISVFFKGTQAVTGLDNIAFLSRGQLGAVEDAGDLLHGQRNALDSAYSFDVDADYSNAQNQPVRWLAEGRDASATIDAAAGGFGKNDGDNEITGLHVSDGDPAVEGILGAKSPKLGDKKWRWFYTQQHGDNTTYEVLTSPHRDGD
jgi:secreted PhoX family phosphatase